MFGAVMTDVENCRPFLERTLGFPIEKIVVDKEKSIIYNPQYKSIRLDVYAKDENNTCYNVEMQIVREVDLPKRTRYYHSQMDMDLLLTGLDYEELSDVYVIFICDFDPFGKGLYKYTFDNVCKEDPNLSLGDGNHTIFLSTKGKNTEDVPETLVNFLKFVSASLDESTNDFQDDFVKKMQQSVQKIKGNREMETKHMWFELLLRDQHKVGKREGKAEGKAEAILDLLSELGTVSAELYEKIMQEKDAEVLKQWLKLSAKVDSIDQFLKEM